MCLLCSMAGSRIKQVAETLQLFLRSLPEGTFFNIIGFGDRVCLIMSNHV